MCLTCSIIKGDRFPYGGLIYQDDEVIMHHCIDVNVPGYLVLSPLRHITDYNNLTDVELTAVMKVMKCVVAILYRIPNVEKVYILNFSEETSHFHFHIFPRYSWMANKSNMELFLDEKLDGAKLFSFYRSKNKSNDLDVPEIKKTIDFIRSQLYVTKEK